MSRWTEDFAPPKPLNDIEKMTQEDAMRHSAIQPQQPQPCQPQPCQPQQPQGNNQEHNYGYYPGLSGPTKTLNAEERYSKPQVQPQQQQQQPQQPQQPPTFYEMKNPKKNTSCYVYLNTNTQKQNPSHGVVIKINGFLGFNKSYVVKLDDGKEVQVKTVYTDNNALVNGGRRRKSKKLCKKRNSRSKNKRRHSRSRSKC